MSKRLKLQGVWATPVFSGVVLVFYDAFVQPLVEIKGVPALGVIGAALMLLAVTAILNWMFKEAWDERNPANSNAQNDEPAQ